MRSIATARAEQLASPNAKAWERLFNFKGSRTRDSFFGRDTRQFSINLRGFTVDADSTIEMLPKSSEAKTT